MPDSVNSANNPPLPGQSALLGGLGAALGNDSPNSPNLFIGNALLNANLPGGIPQHLISPPLEDDNSTWRRIYDDAAIYARTRYNQLREGTRQVLDQVSDSARQAWSGVKGGISELSRSATQPVHEVLDRAQRTYDLFFGPPTDASQKAWFFPLAALALGGGAYLAYRFLSDILNKRRQEELREELEEAEAEYEASLMSQFEKKKIEKAGAVVRSLYPAASSLPRRYRSSLLKRSDTVRPAEVPQLSKKLALIQFFQDHNATLDKYAQALEKLAQDYSSFYASFVPANPSGSEPRLVPESASLFGQEKSAGLAQSALGIYLTLALLLAAGSGWLTYRLLNKGRPESVFEQFARRRAASTDYFGLGRRYSYDPVEFEVVPNASPKKEVLVSDLSNRSPYTGLESLDSNLPSVEQLDSGTIGNTQLLVGEVEPDKKTAPTPRSRSARKSKSNKKKKTNASSSSWSVWPFGG
jgi:thiol-disulfide isomerase/thioredoxin